MEGHRRLKSSKRQPQSRESWGGGGGPPNSFKQKRGSRVVVVVGSKRGGGACLKGDNLRRADAADMDELIRNLQRQRSHRESEAVLELDLRLRSKRNIINKE